MASVVGSFLFRYLSQIRIPNVVANTNVIGSKILRIILFLISGLGGVPLIVGEDDAFDEDDNDGSEDDRSEDDRSEDDGSEDVENGMGNDVSCEEIKTACGKSVGSPNEGAR